MVIRDLKYSRFPDELISEKLEGQFREGRQLHITLVPFRFEVWHKGSGWFITVPANFITDFASVPGPIIKIWPPDGDWKKAALIHDWLYELGVIGCEDIGDRFLVRKFADDVFLDAMICLRDVGLFKRTVAYRAVRSFGDRNFSKRFQTLTS